MIEKHIESDSEPSSDVSYSESTDNEEQAKKQVGGGSLKIENNDIEKVEGSLKQIKKEDSMDRVSKGLEQLQIKNVEG